MHRRVLLRAMVRTAYTNDRHVHIGKQGFDDRVVKIGNHAITQPLFDVFNTRAKIFFDENVPFRLRRL
ncbi:hypothetical protein D3C81_2333190 [compost metagenome]